jgi:hypothetical protein
VIGRTTLRLYIAGRLVDEATVLEDGVEEVAARHVEMAEAAEKAGQRFMVEVVFADGEHVRWGTDPGGMVEPTPTEDVGDSLRRRFEQP